MKEAAGEANMTVITIVLIAVVLAVGTLVVNGVMSNTKKSSCCNSAGGYWNGGKCYSSYSEDSSGKKTYTGEMSDANDAYNVCLREK